MNDFQTRADTAANCESRQPGTPLCIRTLIGTWRLADDDSWRQRNTAEAALRLEMQRRISCAVPICSCGGFGRARPGECAHLW